MPALLTRTLVLAARLALIVAIALLAWHAPDMHGHLPHLAAGVQATPLPLHVP